MNRTLLAVAALAVVLAVPCLPGQNESAKLPTVGDVTAHRSTLGPVDNPGTSPRLVAERVLRFAGASFVQLEFGRVALPNGGYLELRSLRDGSSEIIRGGHSSYFNGDAVRVRLWAGPGTSGTLADIVSVAAGRPAKPGREDLCSSLDNRRPSTDRRVARLLLRTNTLVLVCTGYLFSSTNCFATAGSCLRTRLLQSVTAQFSVPPSSSNGTIQHPPASSQSGWNAASAISANTGADNNWGVFTTQVNTTGRHAGANQGTYYRFVTSVPTSRFVKLVGYGSTVDLKKTHTQQFHVGTLSSISGNRICHRTDTTGGNEGSPIVNANNDLAYGVSTSGGCTRSGGCNFGTASWNAGFVAARQTICRTKKPGKYNLFGQGCPGSSSGSGTCLESNGACGGVIRNVSSVTLALILTAPSTRSITITGGALKTRSTLSTASVRLGLYLADAAGRPQQTPVRTGNASFTSTYGWGTANWAPITIPAGSRYFLGWTDGGIYMPVCSSGGTKTGSYWKHSSSTTWNRQGDHAWTFRIRCSGGVGPVPLLTNVGVPETGRSFQLVLSRALPNSSAMLAFGASNTTMGGIPLPLNLAVIGAPNCVAYQSTDIIMQAVPTSAAGTAAATFTVPNNPAFVGVKFYNQWLVIDPRANALGLVTTNGGAGEVGG